jgi:hypothetical protein
MERPRRQGAIWRSKRSLRGGVRLSVADVRRVVGRRERGRRPVVAWERDHGALTDEELRDADAVLDKLLSASPRKSRAKRSARKA